MTVKTHFTLLAAYNQTMNAQAYAAAAQLSVAELEKDRGAFFGSILGTLNHLVVGDTIWLKRFAQHPVSQRVLQEMAARPHPVRLDEIVFQDFGELSAHREWLDQLIINWIDDLSESGLESTFSFHSMKGHPFNKRYSQVILHFFNHQTHHRGQVSTLLSQAGVNIGVTDLLVMVPEEAMH